MQLREGNKQAFDLIYQRYSVRLYGNLLKLTRSTSEAEDVLQEVFLKVWNNRANIDPERSFRSYLFKIAENKIYDFFRQAAKDRRRAAHLYAAVSTEPFPIEGLLEEEKIGLLQKAIESLPQQRQQVFRLCKLEGKTYKEVSEMLGISVSTISDHIVKATKSIRNYFEDNEHALNIVLLSLILSQS